LISLVLFAQCFCLVVFESLGPTLACLGDLGTPLQQFVKKQEIKVMAKVYVINNDGVTEEMSNIRCENEDLELQRILEINPDLVPGDQINPDDPRRWLIVKREMPIPDPNTGGNRWSIDMFFVDQNAMPTFIECKRYKDTRARREVIGQMLEYAANGHHYWSKEEMRDYAEITAEQNSTSLEEVFNRLQPEETVSADEFFQHVQENLREGQIRLIFFMEEAPTELKSVVDFLNKQMERSEVLIVEARQYEYKGLKIVTPILFGFSEQARQIKKIVSITSRQRRQWDKESFFQDASKKLSEEQINSIQRILDKSLELNCILSWGTGKSLGLFSAKWAHLAKYPIFSIYSDGKLTFRFGNLSDDPEGKKLNPFLKHNVVDLLKLPVPDDYESRLPSYPIEEWSNKTDAFIKMLDLLVKEYSSTTHTSS